MKSYFNFSRGQRIGVITFAIIIVLQIVFLNKGSGNSIPDPFVISAEQNRILDSTITQSKVIKDQKYDNKKSYTLVQFDPNDYQTSDWERIGFSKKQSSIIVNYKSKINGFKKKSDVQKIFVINEVRFKELEPFIEIKKSKINKSVNSSDYDLVENDLKIFELNSASLEDLIEVKGIGKFTANAILKHKTLIGGFHSMYQLKEIYGIEDINYEKISTQLEIDRSRLIKINVNELSIFELKKHHYVTWNTAEAIINTRLTGKLTDLNFLVNDEVLSIENLNVILPYIQF